MSDSLISNANYSHVQSFSSFVLEVRICPSEIILSPVRAGFSTVAELAFLVGHKFCILHVHHQWYIILPQTYLPPPRPETVRQQHHLYLVSSASWTSALILSGSLNLIQFKAVIDNPRLLGEPQAHFISSHLCFHVKQGQGPWELLGMFQRLPQSQKGASHSNIHLLENWKDKISTFLKLY